MFELQILPVSSFIKWRIIILPALESYYDGLYETACYIISYQQYLTTISNYYVHWINILADYIKQNANQMSFLFLYFQEKEENVKDWNWYKNFIKKCL